MGKQLSFRLRDGDDKLAQRLIEVSKRGAQGDMIRLALYRFLLPDDALPAELVEVAAHFKVASRDPVEKSPMMQALVEMQQSVVALLERAPTMHKNNPHEHSTPSALPEPHALGGEVPSSGIRMDGPRKRPPKPRTADSPKAGPGPDTIH